LRINDIAKMPCLRGFARFAYTALFAVDAPRGSLTGLSAPKPALNRSVNPSALTVNNPIT
jgi:hypothetical protein